MLESSLAENQNPGPLDHPSRTKLSAHAATKPGEEHAVHGDRVEDENEGAGDRSGTTIPTPEA